MIVGDYEVDRYNIKGYFTEEFNNALMLWSRFKRFGLPDSRGWIYNNLYVINLIEAFENEVYKYNEEKKRINAS